MIKLAPVYYTSNMERTREFAAALGFVPEATHVGGGWVELPAPNAQLNLHAMPNDADNPLEAGGTELAFESDDDPDTVAESLAAAGFDDAIVLDENYGRILRVTGPDGVRVQINFSDRSLYTA